MAAVMTTQKKQLTLDTDWRTAASVLGMIVVFALFGIGLLWATLSRKWLNDPLTWDSFVAVIMLIVALIIFYDRTSWFALVLFLFQPLLRIIGWLFHFSLQAVAMNEWVGRWAMIAGCLIFCIDGILWFKARTIYS